MQHPVASEGSGHERLDSAVMTEWSDADLLQGICARDDQAWNQLVNKHGGRLWAIARSYGLSSDAALDAVQGTWLMLLDHADRIHTPEALGGWLAQVVKHEAIRVSKDRQRQVERAEKLGHRTRLEVDPDEDSVVLRDELAGVSAVFGRLSERCQQLLRLVFSSESLSYEEIADVLGVPQGSLGPTRARCLKKLRSFLP
jgi:RNA polymerase sigma factor (sigma-70 family)